MSGGWWDRTSGGWAMYGGRCGIATWCSARQTLFDSNKICSMRYISCARSNLPCFKASCNRCRVVAGRVGTGPYTGRRGDVR